MPRLASCCEAVDEKRNSFGMKLQTFAKVLPVLLREPSVLLGNREYVLIVSHMRSYSSLLCHILGSHGEISGHAEMMQPYSRTVDLLRLRYRVHRETDRPLDGRFILDKILHNRLAISQKILDLRRVALVFLLRRPDDTLKSIINMGRTLTRVEWYLDQEKVLAYYRDRLDRMVELAQTGTARRVFLESERILDDTSCVLHHLSRWLGLASDLQEPYMIFESTGRPGRGDPSQRIREGRVIRRRDSHDHIVLDVDVVGKARVSYEACCAALRDHCQLL